MEKILLFSHESDIDGLGCVVLAKLAFKNLDYVLLPDIRKLELTFREYIQSDKLANYDRIYVTDLALYDPALTMVEESSLKDRVLVFDHHKMAIKDNMDRYSFTTIIEEENDRNRCGTELFYDYLVKNNLLVSTPALEEFVELTRLEDTWEWKKYGEIGVNAHDLAFLLNIIGKDSYIKNMISRLLSNQEHFFLSDYEKSLVQNKKNEYNNKIKEILSTAEYYVDEFGNKFCAVFSDYEYRNDLAEYIVKEGNPKQVSYIIVVAMDKGEYGQKSYRKVVDSFDVNEIAMTHGGGGHPGAAAVVIREEQKEHALTLTKDKRLKYLIDCKY